MTETNVVNGYEICWHIYINMLFIYLGCAFAQLLRRSFVPRYRTTVATLAP